MKRMLLLLALSLLMMVLPLGAFAAGESEYVDVSEDDWYAWSVADVTRRGLMIGTGNEEFSPEADLSRAMLVTVLWRLAGEPAAAVESSFLDVPVGKWYTEAVAWAAAEGIAEGYGDGRFGPTDSLTREQLAAFFYRWAEENGYDVSLQGPGVVFGVESAADWAADAMAWAGDRCFLNGSLVNDGGIMSASYSLCPGKGATRGETAVFLSRLCRAYLDGEAEEPVVLYRPVSDHGDMGGYLWNFMTMELPEFWQGNVRVVSGSYAGVLEAVYFTFEDLSNHRPRSDQGYLFCLTLWPEGKDSGWFGSWETLGDAADGKSGRICTVDAGPIMGRLCLYVDYREGEDGSMRFNPENPGNYRKLSACIDGILDSIRFDSGVTVVDVAPGFDIPLG